MALDSIRNDGISAKQSGCNTEDDNGNGSIMRILPAALYFRKEPAPVFLDRIHEISSITHSHPRSKMGCGIYSLIVRELTKTDSKINAYGAAVDAALEYYGARSEFNEESSYYGRILSGQLPDLDENDIQSSGYIIDTLEAALWCFLHSDTTRDTLLAAVNLGLETDTMGTLAGGLSGLQYGIDSIPVDWLDSLARKQEIDVLIDAFVQQIVK
jgi:ADP-ribosylglycohydrolase